MFSITTAAASVATIQVYGERTARNGSVMARSRITPATATIRIVARTMTGYGSPALSSVTPMIVPSITRWPCAKLTMRDVAKIRP